VPKLVILTGPIAAGKNATADALATHLSAAGRTVVIVDVDDVAHMVADPGAANVDLWFAAHEAHGALVGQWMRSAADVVIAVGPIFSIEEQKALTRHLPPGTRPLWVLLDAPIEVTLARVQSDPTRGRSQELTFHRHARERFRALSGRIPADLTFDSSEQGADEIALRIVGAL
jgi:adenylylsulfate kinase-like enzyme